MRALLAALAFCVLAFGFTAVAAAAAPAAATRPNGLAEASAARADVSAMRAGAARCRSLATVMAGRWPDGSTRVLASVWRAAGSRIKTQQGSIALPAHCDLQASLQPRVGRFGEHYAIRFHLRLPQHWNGRFFFQGGGGSDGDIGNAIGPIAAGVPAAIEQGYAVVSQDSGHDNAVNSDPARGGTAAFGLDPRARADYGGASLEPVARAAKAVVRRYYGRPPVRSYFVGCSKGGQEGMVFAERDPGEFDGIVAADPGISLPRAAIAEAWDTQAFASLIPRSGHTSAVDPAQLPKVFSAAQFATFRKAILAACDADDGVSDGITANFTACTWPRVRAQLVRWTCPKGGAEACLTARQIAVLARVYAGPKNSAGKALYASWPLDAGAGSAAWRIWKIGPASGGFPGINVALGGPALAEIFTTPPTVLHAGMQAALDYLLNFDFDRDAPKIYTTGGPFHRSAWQDLDARTADLAAFEARGGKLIIPQGVSDPAFSLDDTLAWYREVNARDGGRAASFVRVFAVPGMAHCSGGPATDEFDALAALVKWVEHAQPPDRILARAGPASPWPGRTRPLCPFPQYARYSGRGSIEKAASFECVRPAGAPSPTARKDR
ncbi:MAG: tannase/feruloyl esterase family alpha/beta hydrolase [Steroidobacteraceae bacterium]